MVLCKVYNYIIVTGDCNNRNNKYIIPIHRFKNVFRTVTVNLQCDLQTEEEEINFVERRDGMSNNEFRAVLTRYISKF